MRSRKSRGVPEWSGGKDLHIGSPVSAIGKVSGSPVVYGDHLKGPGGPPGGATYPGGPHGLKWEGTQPKVGWAPPPPRAHAPRIWGNPKGGGAPLALWGKETPLAAAPPTRWDLRGPDPLSLALYIVEGWEGSHTFQKAQPLPSPTPLLLRVSLAKPCQRTATPSPPCRRAAVGALFLNLSLLLAGSRCGRRHRAARVLNMEVPLFGT